MMMTVPFSCCAPSWHRRTMAACARRSVIHWFVTPFLCERKSITLSGRKENVTNSSRLITYRRHTANQLIRIKQSTRQKRKSRWESNECQRSRASIINGTISISFGCCRQTAIVFRPTSRHVRRVSPLLLPRCASCLFCSVRKRLLFLKQSTDQIQFIY